MNRNMRMLHKENNRLDKTLCEDYQRLMTDIDVICEVPISVSCSRKRSAMI